MSGKVERFELVSEEIFAGGYCVATSSMAECEDGEFMRYAPYEKLLTDYAALEAQVAGLDKQVEALQRALAYWMPKVPADPLPWQERCAEDAMLLMGYEGPDEESWGAGLEADAARYRWLRSRGFGFTHDEFRRGISTSRWGHWDFDTDEGFAAQCDATIDAAIAKEREAT